MKCVGCGRFERRNLWTCPECGTAMTGGVVFVTGISGSGVGEYLLNVAAEATKPGHAHVFKVHDVGRLMKEHAEADQPDINWNQILDADRTALRHLRALAFQEIGHHVELAQDTLHIIDLHLCFRWYSYLTRGFDPQLLDDFRPFVRCFVNVIEDLPKVHNRLATTAWGEREILELLVWRDEELLLSELFADACGRVDRFAIARGEPPTILERLIWHPEMKRVYLSFPITNIQNDDEAREEIEGFRDALREFLVVFDPYACKDYDETYKRPEMKALRKQVGEATVDRDYRFIDQAHAVVVYFPRKVTSKGVDSEMNHALRTGKPIYLYSPEDPGGGPFAVAPSHFRTDPGEYLELLKQELSPVGGLG